MWFFPQLGTTAASPLENTQQDSTAMGNWTFSVPSGYFDDYVAIAAQLPEGIRLTTQPLFALTPRAYPSDDPDAADQPPWARFTAHVAALNREAPAGVSFKILFLTRHGQGYHNLRKQQVQDGGSSLISEVECFDAPLTPLAVEQARALAARWLAVAGLPPPRALYTSPLTRCLQTAAHHLRPVLAARGLPFRPVVKEALRERWTTHACDRRRPRAWIEERWPACVVEDALPAEDELAARPRAETEAENTARVLGALEDVFEEGAGVEVVAWTFHSLAMRALLGGLGMAPFKVQPATTVALLVRGERVPEVKNGGGEDAR